MSSSARSIKHGSFVIERKFDHDPVVVFRAWTHPEAKARWFNGPPDKWTEQVREMDVRLGGRDRLIGKFIDGSESRYEAIYFDVVPDRRLVYAYDMYWQGKKISVTLATVEFVQSQRGTKLILTENGAYLDGYDDAGSRERGTLTLIDNLGKFARRRLRVERRHVRDDVDHLVELELLDRPASSARPASSCAFRT